PLSLAEASDLAVSVGARMGIELEEKALSALYEASGGHAFLYRNFASTVVQTLPIDVFRRRLTKSIVCFVGAARLASESPRQHN
ncbi:hypothetical protein, partial [Curtobacterium sp. MMLR14_014]|uniref:hypothetical protein n=1 Tax=Curtobacterium sp. MMLR14_014 TaxID=1898744 RepID=UPI001C31BBCE